MDLSKGARGLLASKGMRLVEACRNERVGEDGMGAVETGFNVEVMERGGEGMDRADVVGERGA